MNTSRNGVDESKENMLRLRFHFRGLSNKSKSKENKSFSSPTTSSQLDNNSPKHDATKSVLRENTSDNAVFSDSVTPGLPHAKVRESKVQEISGTPSVSLRKCLLDKQLTPSRPNREVSPGLHRMISTPHFEKIRSVVKTQLENSQFGTSFTLHTDRGSPGLTQLRQTPGKPLKEKREVLANKHDETRRNADNLNIGGGVSMWPQMEDMRLSQRECIQLVLVSITLGIITCFSFNYIHGNALLTLRSLHLELKEFGLTHQIRPSLKTLLGDSYQWHQNYSSLIERVEKSFLISSDDVKCHFLFYIVSSLYVCGIGVLLYYLADNVMSSSKLSPNRIKKWVCLLVVIGCWTISMARLFYEAFMVEMSAMDNVSRLNTVQKDVITELYPSDPDPWFQLIVSYWTSKFLSTNSDGVINIFVKLVFSLLHIYGFVEFKGHVDS